MFGPLKIKVASCWGVLRSDDVIHTHSTEAYSYYTYIKFDPLRF